MLGCRPARSGAVEIGCQAPHALGFGYQLGEIDQAGSHQGNVLWAVTALEIIPHGFDRQIGDRLNRAQHATAQRMLAEVQSLATVVGPERRLVLVHLDLFDDHLLFGVEIFLAQAGRRMSASSSTAGVWYSGSTAA